MSIMNKKGALIAAAVAATFALSACSHPQQMPQGPMAGQAGPSTKLGKMGTSCRSHASCRAHCKSHSCSGKTESGY